MSFLSPYIFLICAELINTKFRKDQNINGLIYGEKEKKGIYYADDSAPILRDKKSVKKTLEFYLNQSAYSGLKLNLDKSVVMSLRKDNFIPPFGIKKISRYKFLGIMIDINDTVCHEENIERPLENIKRVYIF